MLDQAVLDLARADTVAARGDHIVVAALEEDVAVLVHAAEIAGAGNQDVDFLRQGLVRPPVAPVRGRLLDVRIAAPEAIFIKLHFCLQIDKSGPVSRLGVNGNCTY